MPGSIPPAPAAYDATSRRAAIDRIDRLATWLDTAFILPGTNVRFGVESLLRLVPGIGDAAASALSCYLLYEAHRLGVPRLLFARMIGNVLLEGTVGTVPFAGDAFDVFFRANRRNVALLRRHFAGESRAIRKSANRLSEKIMIKQNAGGWF